MTTKKTLKNKRYKKNKKFKYKTGILSLERKE